MTLDFTHNQSVENLATGRPTITPVTIPGSARNLRGEPADYEALQLRQSQARTLLWTPAVYGQSPDPSPGDTCRFSGKQWTAKSVNPWAPDGVLAHARIIVVGA